MGVIKGDTRMAPVEEDGMTHRVRFRTWVCLGLTGTSWGAGE